MSTITIPSIGTFPTWAVAVAVGAFLLAGGAIAWLWYREKRRIEEAIANVESELDADDDEGKGTAGQLEPPDIGGGIWGLFATWRQQRKQKRLARKGYIKWYKIGSRLDRPRWVKPDYRGAGEPEYYDSDDDATYLFPDEALLTDASTGAHVAFHRQNEVEPIPMREPGMPVLDADRLEEVINMEAESEAPTWFSRLDLDTGTIMMIMIGGLFLLFAGYRYMG